MLTIDTGETEAKLELIPEQFKLFLDGARQVAGKSLSMFVLPKAMHMLIANAFLAGHLNTEVTYNTDKDGRIRMSLDTVPVMFTDSLELGRWMLVLDGEKNGQGTNPICPRPIGPDSGPEDPGGGTPAAAEVICDERLAA